MAIRDLLYICAECGREGGLKPAENGEVCDRCSTRYTRVDGALIRCEPPGKPERTLHPSEWVDLLARSDGFEVPDRAEPVILRTATTYRPLRIRGEYLGRVEQFGPPEEGTVELTPDALIIRTADRTDHWRLTALTAVQPSSTALQVKLRDGPLLSLKFPQGSALLWEERLRACLQACYSRLGRGTIIEFQPQILCR